MNWMKGHKLTTLLLLVVIYLLWQQRYTMPFPSLNTASPKLMMERGVVSAPASIGMGTTSMKPPFIEDNVAPVDTKDRLVIRDTSMSLVVQNVADAIKTIQQKAASLGGYLVDSHIAQPEESANGSINVRVPEEKLTETLEAFRKIGLRVVDEQVSGRDVTDQYVDLDARLVTLNKTKAKFEEILEKATQIQDLLNVQRELVNLQAQIDSVKGQQQYLSQSAKLSKITVYLSTDEFSLPYAPKEPWRPSVVFKLAVRSLVSNLRNVGSALIWILVYSPLWGTIAGVVWMIRGKLPAPSASSSKPAS